MNGKKRTPKAEKSGHAATAQQSFVPSTTLERAVRPYLLSEIHVDPRQPRAGTSPKKTANVELIRTSLIVDGDGVALVETPVQIRKRPAWADEFDEPWMLFDGECRDLAAVAAGAKWILGFEVDIPEDEVFERQMKTMARDGLDEAALLDAIRRFDEDHPGVNATNAAVRLGMTADAVRGLRKIVPLPASVRMRFMSGEHTIETCGLIAQIEGATPDEKTARQEKASAAVAALDARKAREHIRSAYLLLLKSAPFEREDAALVPEAGVCSVCPHRSGAQATLFAATDIADDSCTKKACWDEKIAATEAKRPPAAETNPEPPKPKKPGKPTTDDVRIAAFLARGDVDTLDLENVCGGMSGDGINEALARLAGVGNDRAKRALQDRTVEDKRHYSRASAAILAKQSIDALAEALAHLCKGDSYALLCDVNTVFETVGYYLVVRSAEDDRVSQRACYHCSELYDPTGELDGFCSKACEQHENGPPASGKREAVEEGDGRSAVFMCTCVVCGDTFEAVVEDSRFCSDNCQIDGELEREQP